MAVTEERVVKNPTWIQRLGASFRGMVVGLVVFIAGFPILFWNEGRAVDTAKRLKEGAGAVVDVPADRVDAANEGKFVHVSGRADTQEVLRDDVFGVATNALRLVRTVEIYQVVEHRETRREERDGKTVESPVYTYENEWCAKPVDSSQFNNAERRTANPPLADMRFGNADQISQNVTLGAFALSDKHVRRIGERKRMVFPVDFRPPASVPGAQYQNGYFYVPFDVTSVAPLAAPVTAPASRSAFPLQAAASATNMAEKLANAVSVAITGGRSVAVAPRPGDIRVSFEVVLPHDVTIMERQEGNTFVPWPASDGNTLSYVRDGRVPAEKIIADALSTNKKVTWLMRLVGLLVMFVGLKMVLGPLDTLVDAIPILNGIVAAGTSLVAFLVSGACALITIGISWVFHRPLVGLSLLAGGATLLAITYLMKKKTASATP